MIKSKIISTLLFLGILVGVTVFTSGILLLVLVSSEKSSLHWYWIIAASLLCLIGGEMAIKTYDEREKRRK